MTEQQCNKPSEFAEKINFLPKKAYIFGMWAGSNIGYGSGMLLGFAIGSPLSSPTFFMNHLSKMGESFGLVTGFTIGLMPSMVLFPIELIDEALQNYNITNYDFTENAYSYLSGEA